MFEAQASFFKSQNSQAYQIQVNFMQFYTNLDYIRLIMLTNLNVNVIFLRNEIKYRKEDQINQDKRLQKMTTSKNHKILWMC